MNNPALVTIVIHGLVATLLAIGGGFCLFFGFRLLFKQKGSESKSTFETTIGQHKIAFTAGAAGTTVVLVSAIWVGGSIVALPSFSQTEGGTTVVAAAIPFQGSISALATPQKELIDTIGPSLMVSGTPLVIEGYADTGSKVEDMVLAERRAAAVKDYLVREYKLSSESITVKSYGETPAQTDGKVNSVVIRSGQVGD